MITKVEALEAWDIIDDVIDTLDYEGKFSNRELNTIEKSMAIIKKFIEERGN